MEKTRPSAVAVASVEVVVAVRDDGVAGARCELGAEATASLVWLGARAIGWGGAGQEVEQTPWRRDR